MNRKSIIILVSLIPVMIILISTFSSEISNLRSKNKSEFSLDLPLEANKQDYNSFSYKNLQEYITRKLYVPNYDAEVTITPVAENIILNNNLRFKIKVTDKGIMKLNKPFFYIFLVDPDSQIRGCFPNCNYDTRKAYFDFWAMTSRPTSSSYGNYNLENEILPLKINNSLFGFYRESLLEGKGVYRFESSSTLYTSKESFNYYYNYQPDKVGDWEIYVLVFGEEYFKRESTVILYQQYERNKNNDIVNYAKSIVTVKGAGEIPISNESRWPIFFKILAAFIGSILTFFGVYVPFSKYYEKIMKFLHEVYKEKQYWIGLIVILLIFLIIQYLIMK